MNSSTASRQKVVGGFLTGGWIVFWAGAVNPWALDFFTAGSLPDFLAVVAAHQQAWLFIAGSFAVGVLLTLAGLVVLRTLLGAAGERLWSELGQVAYFFGAVLWIVSLAFRATVTVSAAKETAASGAVPAWYTPIWTWAGALFAIYMVLAYLAIAAYGKALLATDLAPRWAGRALLVFGLAGALGFVARVPVFDPPLMIHLMPGILGVVLLLRARRADRAADP